eukprot:TRINITY_DN26711_c0_g1_i1.p1 TRINITY_DN26711_c0_g1~~TRINITY_DN26711_c0_g1_i1.p1  ORF type:complete len:109 (-),score=14.20 TRINITY_DN26711_c0_g1_i1:300-626(-)
MARHGVLKLFASIVMGAIIAISTGSIALSFVGAPRAMPSDLRAARPMEGLQRQLNVQMRFFNQEPATTTTAPQQDYGQSMVGITLVGLLWPVAAAACFYAANGNPPPE